MVPPAGEPIVSLQSFFQAFNWTAVGFGSGGPRSKRLNQEEMSFQTLHPPRTGVPNSQPLCFRLQCIKVGSLSFWARPPCPPPLSPSALSLLPSQPLPAITGTQPGPPARANSGSAGGFVMRRDTCPAGARCLSRQRVTFSNSMRSPVLCLTPRTEAAVRTDWLPRTPLLCCCL